MSLYQSELKRVPVGMNDTADASLLHQARCSVMLGLAPVAPGELGECLRKAIVGWNGGVYAPPGVQYEGIIPYNGATAANDLVLVVKSGLFYKTKVSGNTPQTIPDAIKVTADQLVAVANNSGVALTANKRVRWVQHLNETVIVQEGGLTPLRFNGTAVYKLGLATPAAPTGGAAAAGALTGDFQYWTTTADELGRESSPSPALAVTLAGQRKVVNWAAPGTTENVQKVYLYRTLASGSIGYRVVEAGFTGPGAWTTSYNDNIPDDQIEGNTQSPEPFQNDPPLSASLVTKWGKRVVLNSSADRSVVQASNENMPGSYSVIGSVEFPTDGITERVLSEYGDEITAIAGLGSGLGIFTRRTTSILTGDQPGNFRVDHLHNKGCTSPDAVVQCDNRVLFPSEDGVYSLSFNDGFIVRPVSGDLDKTFKSAAIQYTNSSAWPPTTWYTRKDRNDAAVAWFMQGRYYLCMPPYVYVFDLENGGWCLDYMAEQPNSLATNCNGYLSAAVVHLDRVTDVVLFNPGYTVYGGTNIGSLWVGSFYPLMSSVAARSFNFVYETRAIDGAGVHRNSVKRMKRTTFFGSISLAPSDPNAELNLTGTITLNVDGVDVESHPFGIFGNYAARFARAQREGKLIVQEWSTKCVGRVIKVRIQGTAMGRLSVRDMLAEYERRN